ncbi:MAG: transposase [Betaproteobacteria bacterium]|nr:transposase [Betaproteobacteria bacterium]
MTDELEDLKGRLVIGHKRDGRNVYDETAKAQLVALCLRPGASVSRLARECAVNANQVNRWLREHAQRGQSYASSAQCLSAQFVQVPVLPGPGTPVRREAAAVGAISLQARLPNAVVIDLHGLPAGELASVVQALGSLRCSVSTKG